MNRYFMIHRLMGPSILLLLGVIALLHQAHLVHWDLFVPLLLILIGVFKLAERAALAAEPYPPGLYPGAPGPAASPQDLGTPSTASTVPESHDCEDGSEGGRS